MDTTAQSEATPLISLGETTDHADDVAVAAQLVPQFGYDEAERIMLDALADDEPIDEEARQAVAGGAA